MEFREEAIEEMEVRDCKFWPASSFLGDNKGIEAGLNEGPTGTPPQWFPMGHAGGGRAVGSTDLRRPSPLGLPQACNCRKVLL